ncbi:MAG: hypothetical protein ACT4O5_04105 [Gammaproteobacteria bacterium]
MITRRQMLHAAAGGALLPFAGAASRALAEDPAPTAPTLGAIRAVTITATGLAEVEAAWTRFMGYRLISRERLSRKTAKSWGAPALAGKPLIILGPESGEPTYLRFIEQATPADYDLAGTYGWNMTEITVQNSDELYERLKDSPFKVRGPPRTVPTYNYLRAMGAVGPAGERLALTWITETRPDLAVAKSFVGRCFIAVQASPDLPASLEYFRTTFGNVSSPIRKLPSLDLSVVTLNDGAKIEIDQHAPGGRPRERVPGGLPPGLAIVTFECSSFDRMRNKFISPAIPNALEPYRGRRTATMIGAAEELIELVEA